MKHNFFRRSQECLFDEDRTRAFARTLSQMVRPGDVVLDCGCGTGFLSLLAVKEGARRVIAIEQDRALADVAKKNVKLCTGMDRITVKTGDAIASKDLVDIVIIDLLDTMLITDDQVRVANALVAKGVINGTTRVIPGKCSMFFEPVHYDFEFYDCHMPMIIQARNEGAKGRCLTSLGNAVMYRDLSFHVYSDPRVIYEGRHMIHTKGYLNALKFTTVTHLTNDILLGSTTDMSLPVYVPVHEMLVSPGEIYNVRIEYIMSQGFDTLKIDIN